MKPRMLEHRKHFPGEVSAVISSLSLHSGNRSGSNSSALIRVMIKQRHGIWPGLGLKVKAKSLITRPRPRPRVAPRPRFWVPRPKPRPRPPLIFLKARPKPRTNIPADWLSYWLADLLLLIYSTYWLIMLILSNYVIIDRCASWSRCSTSSVTCPAQNARPWRRRCDCLKRRWKSGFKTVATNGNASWLPNWKRPTWLTLPPPLSEWLAYRSSTDNTRLQTALSLPWRLIFHLLPHQPEPEIISQLPVMLLQDFHLRWIITRRSTFRRLTTVFAHLCQTLSECNCCYPLAFSQMWLHPRRVCKEEGLRKRVMTQGIS